MKRTVWFAASAFTICLLGLPANIWALEPGIPASNASQSEGVAAAGQDSPEATDAESQLLAGQLPESVLRDYRTLWPDLSNDEITTRFSTVGARAKLNEEFSVSASFAGTWFDFEANTLHIFSTNDQEALASAAFARSLGVNATPHSVKYSYSELEAKRREVEAMVSEVPDYELSIVAQNNGVLLVLPPDQVELASRAREIAGVEVTLSDALPHGYPAACTDRYNCGGPLRGGINLGRFELGSSLIGCSIGFTVTATDGSRWIYTAGHCVLQSEVDAHTVYGHGEQAIGDARSTYNVGAVDVGRIRNSSSYWQNWGGGYMYHTPTDAIDVDYSILSANTIQVGDPVCFNARNYTPTDDNCGVVTAQNVNGKPQVSGVKVCGGDSGGSSYLIFSGERWAYGLISVSSQRFPPDDCTGNGTGQVSFSSIPLINAYMDSVTAANVRVDVR